MNLQTIKIHKFNLIKFNYLVIQFNVFYISEYEC